MKYFYLKYGLFIGFLGLLVMVGCEKKTAVAPEAPTPQITSIEPDTGYGGDTVIIKGKNFNPVPRKNIITFGGYHSTRAIEATATTLKAIAPSGVGGMDFVTVKVNVIRLDCTHWSNPVYFTFPPVLSVFRDDFSNTRGIEFDKDGNCYVSDADDWVIYKITPDSEKTVYAEVAGTGDIAFDRKGYLYVCDKWDEAIYKVPPGGGDADTLTYDEIPDPFSLDWDNDGNMYVVGERSGLFKITPDGKVTKLDVDIEHGTSLRIVGGYIYWSDRGDWGDGNNCIMKAPITANGLGTPETVYSDPDWNGDYIWGPSGIEVDTEGNVYAVSAYDQCAKLSKFQPDGSASVLIQLPTKNNKFLAFWKDDLYVTTQSEGVIYKVHVGIEGAPPYAWGTTQ